MKRRIWAALVLVAVAASAGTARATQATPSPGFKGTTLAMATFGEINSHVIAEPGWQEKLQTHGRSDLFVQQNTWDPVACKCVPSTGWHTHPGPSLVIVTQGTVTEYDGDDPACTPHVYSANTADNSFVDIGGGAVHIIRDESGAPAQTVAVQLIPAGSNRRVDAPSPGNCSF